MRKSEIKQLEQAYKRSYRRWLAISKIEPMSNESEKALHRNLGFAGALRLVLDLNGIDSHSRLIELENEAQECYYKELQGEEVTNNDH